MTTILVTRPKEEAKKTALSLEKVGFKTIIEPLIAIEQNFDAKSKISKLIKPKSVILITSANALPALCNIDRNQKIITVGKVSAAAIMNLGFNNVTAAGGDVASMINMINSNYPKNTDFLYLSADITSGDLQKSLKNNGYNCDKIIAYHAKPIDNFPNSREKADAVTLFSKRTAEIFIKLDQGKLCDKPIFCISCNVASAFDNTPYKKIHVSNLPNSESLLELIADFQFT